MTLTSPGKDAFPVRFGPLKEEPFGGESRQLSLPPRCRRPSEAFGRWLGEAETEGVANPQLSVKSQTNPPPHVPRWGICFGVCYFTVTFTFAVMPLGVVTVMVVLPLFLPFTTPVSLTLATLGLLLLKVKVVLKPAGSVMTFSFSFSPFFTVALLIAFLPSLDSLTDFSSAGSSVGPGSPVGPGSTEGAEIVTVTQAALLSVWFASPTTLYHT